MTALLLSDNFQRYSHAIQALPLKHTYSKNELLQEDFLVNQQGEIEMYYAPHNEYINPDSKLLIVGITPGWTQMELAVLMARKYLEQGESTEEICRKVKLAARFAGAMRKNLVEMLDTLQLNHYLHIITCQDLFHDGEELLHTTSMLRYPVFVKKQNYNGHAPSLLTTPFLRHFAFQSVKSELLYLNRPFIIPLGKTVQSILQVLMAEGLIERDQCLWGFPHPSGANGHRHNQFMQGMNAMQQNIANFYEN